MNQILVTQKLYITPELRRKKKMYKIQFFLSVLLVCLLFSYYIYAEYDRSKSEEVSKEILEGINISKGVESTVGQDNTIKEYDGVIIVAIDDNENDDQQIINSNQTQEDTVKYTTNSGIEYSVEAILNIPRLGINYPVISEWSEELLKVSLNKYWGPKPNEVGNYCIVGHNYKSGKMFGKLKNINIGEKMELTDLKGRTVTYIVSDKYTIDPTDVNCTSQLTNGRRKLTLITCSNSGSKRLVVQGYEQE